MKTTPSWRMRIPTSVRFIHTTDDAYVIEGYGAVPIAELIRPPVLPPISTTAPPEPEEDGGAS